MQNIIFKSASVGFSTLAVWDHLSKEERFKLLPKLDTKLIDKILSHYANDTRDNEIIKPGCTESEPSDMDSRQQDANRKGNTT